MYSQFYVGYNKLGSLGAKFLSKMRMPELKELDICRFIEILGECMIGNEGTKHLIKAEWPNLQKMYVGKTFVKQISMASGPMDI